mgnify:CR=1 FL=1
MKKTLLLSLKAFDETASIRVLLYSNNFVDLPPEQLDQVNLVQPSKAGTKNKGSRSNDSFLITQINRLVSDIKVGSVLSMENASAISMCTMAGNGPGYTQSLHLVMNLDNKYSKL